MATAAKASPDWTSTVRAEPPQGVVVDTMDSSGRVQPLKLIGRLWFYPDASMYVYYTPAYWKAIAPLLLALALVALAGCTRHPDPPTPVPVPTPIPVPDPTPTPPPIVVDATAEHVASAVNAQRLARGLAALELSPKLSASSQSWADTIAREGVLSHGAFGQRLQAVFPNTAGAEDIAEGQRTVAEVVSAWMSDAPHRANILGPYNTLGVGIAKDASGAIYWVIDFARL